MCGKPEMYNPGVPHGISSETRASNSTFTANNDNNEDGVSKFAAKITGEAATGEELTVLKNLEAERSALQDLTESNPVFRRVYGKPFTTGTSMM